MRKLLNKDSILFGVVATVVSELLCALVVWLVLLLLGYPLRDYARFFAAAFIPPVLLLRHYAVGKAYPATLRAVISTLFVTVVAFMWAMLKYKFITL